MSTPHYLGVPPPSSSLTTTSDNRGIPQRKAPHYSSHVRPTCPKPLNGGAPQARLIRPLTVDEALQYSSLSSIVPFDSGIIPVPNADLPVSAPIFSTPTEVKDAKQSLNHLDQSLIQTRGHSGAIQQVLQDLRSLLGLDRVVEYQFKTPSALKSDVSKLHPKAVATDHLKTSSRLGPLANMLLSSTDVTFRYPTPISPEPPTSKAHSPHTPLPPKLPITPQTLNHSLHNDLAHSQNAKIETTLEASSTPQQAEAQPDVEVSPLVASSDSKIYSTGKAKFRPVVVIPPLPPSSNPEDYKVYPSKPVEEISKSTPSKKRKRDEPKDKEVSIITRDQRALSDSSLVTLQDVISDIFEAENDFHLKGDILGKTSGGAFFVINEGLDGSSITLSPATNAKLESALQKVVTLSRFKDIPAEQLCKLQKLCEGALISADIIDISFQSEWTEDEVSSWLERLDTVDGSLRSARTILRIMSGGREEKQIYSEELLQRVIDLLHKVMDRCVIPIVECRSSDSQSSIFSAASSHKKVILQLLHNAGKVMLLLLELLKKVELAEGIITPVEFFVIRLLFVENAHAEKESALGIGKFESFRRTAMNVIAEVFSKYPEQRRFILDEVLTSLQKLPVKAQQARQYKLDDGTSMQLVSALLMRLVHSSGLRSSSRLARKGGRTLPEVDQSVSAELGTSEAEDPQSSDSKTSGSESDSSNSQSPKKSSLRTANIHQGMFSDVKSLYDAAVSTAQYIIEFFVKRASSASKTGDQPHRQLLDMFVGDLVSVLNNPDWPASELLLRALISKMDRIANFEKGTAPMKNMALEILGIAGSAISDVTSNARHLARTLENDDSTLSDKLTQYLEEHMVGQLDDRALLSWTGPYRAVVEHLVGSSSDFQGEGARGYYLTQWTKLVLWSNNSTTNNPDVAATDVELATRLCKIVASGKWQSIDDFGAVSHTQCRLAYTLTILNMGFCRAFGQILQTLLKSVRSDQITVRSRSLKSVTQMLEKDPTLLDRMPQVMRLIISCGSDQSSMVRDSSLALIGKCIVLKPGLELGILENILLFTSDSAPGIRKRSMKLLKDIYLRHTGDKVRTEIADSLLQRVQDPDEGVADLARQMFQDVWLAPFWTSAIKSEPSVQDRIALKEQVALIIRTVQRNERTIPVLQSLLSQVMGTKSKEPIANSNACKAMVAAAFEGIVDSTELPGRPEQRNILQTLTVFSRANPKLFTQQQLGLLQPYISHLSTADDLSLFRSVVVILRCVMPTLPAIQKDFLRQVQDDLLRNITKLAKAELDEVVACLWTINGELGNFEKLVNLEVGVLNKLYQLRGVDFNDAQQQQQQQQQELSRLKRIILLAGHFAKHCDFQPQSQRFSTSLSWWAGESVPECVIDTIRPFTEKHQPLGLRSVAFDCIGMICQAWPKNFSRKEITHTFQQVLKDDDPELQRIVLSNFRDFFAVQDRQVEAKTSSGERDPLANGKIGGSMIASDNDGAAALIAQGFLKDILRIALSSQDSYALAATEVVASITRQGLVHPKECGPALVALETSTNPRIAEVAFQQHGILHQQHESMFEREYMRAIHQAYIYQKDVVQDLRGFTINPYKAKLHSMYEVIKTSKGKYQGKFLSNYCARIDFDVAKLDLSASPPAHLQYAKFLVENLAFFDYGRVEDVLHATSCIEKTVAGTGAGVAHAINTEVFHVRIEPTSDLSNAVAEQPLVAADALPQDIDQVRLRHLTTASMILSMLWETRTFIRRLYGISGSHQHRENKVKASKDLSKAPTKINGVSGDRFSEAITRISHALDTQDLSLTQCKEFADLLAIDNEVKVSAEAEDDDDGRLQTPSGEDDGESLMQASGGSRAVKRKHSASLASTPMKKKRGRPSLGGRRKSGKSVDEDEDE